MRSITRTIWLIRHAESASNAGAATEHPATIPLSSRGEEQARLLGHRFPRKPERVIVSRYSRTRETAGPLLERFPDCPVEEWPIHELTFLEPARYRGTTEAQRKGPSSRYWEVCEPAYKDGPGAESYHEFVDRVRSSMERLSAGMEEFTAVFTHGYFIKAILWEILTSSALAAEKSMRGFAGFHDTVPIENAAVFPVRLDHAGAWHVGKPWAPPYHQFPAAGVI